MSSFERFANGFSKYWLDNAVWLALLVAAVTFALVLALLLTRVKSKSASPAGSGAESIPAPPGNS